MTEGNLVYFDALFKRIADAEKVPYRKVSADGWEPALNRCHENVDFWVKTHPEVRALRGWLVSGPDASGRFHFAAHSALCENGEPVDITPFDPNTSREPYRFLRHLGTEEEFAAMKGPCSEVLYPPITNDEWVQWQREAPLLDTDSVDEDSF